MTPLTVPQREFLKRRAHALQPVVMIGNQGLTPAVQKEIEHALAAHELIKIKAGSSDAEIRTQWMDHICLSSGAVPVQKIGKMLVLYRASNPPVIALPIKT